MTSPRHPIAHHLHPHHGSPGPAFGAPDTPSKRGEFEDLTIKANELLKRQLATMPASFGVALSKETIPPEDIAQRGNGDRCHGNRIGTEDAMSKPVGFWRSVWIDWLGFWHGFWKIRKK